MGAGMITAAAAAVPTLWIVLGPLGQSSTAAKLLGANAHLDVSGFLARSMEVFGVVHGVPMPGFALLWASIPTVTTIGTSREHLPFSLIWWSFTFPGGTCVTGLSGLAAHTGLVAFEVIPATHGESSLKRSCANVCIIDVASSLDFGFMSNVRSGRLKVSEGKVCGLLSVVCN